MAPRRKRGAEEVGDPEEVDPQHRTPQSKLQKHGGDEGACAPSERTIAELEASGHLEQRLWPSIDLSSAQPNEIVLLAALVCEKARVGSDCWSWYSNNPHSPLEKLFEALALGSCAVSHPLSNGSSHRPITDHERSFCTRALSLAFTSLEIPDVRKAALPLVSLPLWARMGERKCEIELLRNPGVRKHWNRLQKKERKGSVPPAHQRPEGCVLPAVVDASIDSLSRAASGDSDAIAHCERALELFVDLLSQLPTRRFTKAFLEDRAVLSAIRTSGALKSSGSFVLAQLYDLLVFFHGFEVNEHSGEPVSEQETLSRHFSWMSQLQRMCFRHVPELHSYSLLPVRQAERKSTISEHLSQMSDDRLSWFATQLARCAPESGTLPTHVSEKRRLFVDCIASSCERRPAQTSALSAMPLYPTENVLFDDHAVPAPDYDGDRCLALPKLNLQFLTLRDYILRNFHLYRLETAHGIREHLYDCLAALKPSPQKRHQQQRSLVPQQAAVRCQQNGEASSHHDKGTNNTSVAFNGQARMALPAEEVRIVSIAKPKVGDPKPSAVTAEVTIELSRCSSHARSEWEGIAQHDSIFLLRVDPPDQAPKSLQQDESDRTSPSSVTSRHHGVDASKICFGLEYVRGGEVLEIRDERGHTVRDPSQTLEGNAASSLQGSKRVLVLSLDTSQYQKDVDTLGEDGAETLHTTMNVAVRRRAKESNATSFLLCMRQILEEGIELPPWLNDLFLGYGDPAEVSWRSSTFDEQRLHTLDLKDTLLDGEHAEEALSSLGSVHFGNCSKEGAIPPFTVTFSDDGVVTLDQYKEQSKGPSLEDDFDDAAADNDYEDDNDDDNDAHGGDGNEAQNGRNNEGEEANEGSKRQSASSPKSTLTNRVRFTRKQTESIIAGIQPGLCQIVGPPGTGKTDVAAQSIACLLRNRPNQRILLVTHSNAALNDLFEKLAATDIPKTKMLRLGHGESQMQTGDDFSKEGRVDAMLARRIDLLHRAERIALALSAPADLSASCESAAVLYSNHVAPEWLALDSAIENGEDVKQRFKLYEYFGDSFFHNAHTQSEAQERAQAAMRHVRRIFAELEELRPLEVVQSQKDRGDLLLMKRAKVIAMTCTHAAIKREDYANMGLSFETVVMEESAKAGEFEAAVPLFMQKNSSRLERVLMIGDDQQLPPVVTSPAFQRYSRLDQSLFSRLRRLGAPEVTLEAQGRCRPSLASLWSWKYEGLTNLPRTLEGQYTRANAGFVHTAQFVDVQDYMGKGEEQPEAHAFINRGEAEFVCSVYQYMRLIGFMPKDIVVLTTYRAQKQLLRDIFNQRCSHDRLFDLPSRVTTVDKFQGQQASIVLISLVRTRSVGHIRDTRRTVTALSRARYGLYIFGRWSLYASVHQLRPFFQRFEELPKQLALTPGEEHPTTRLETDPVDEDYKVENESVMREIVDDARQRAGEQEQK